MTPFSPSDVWTIPNLRGKNINGDLKSGLFEGQILNGRAIAIVPTIQKPNVLVRISNGWASGF